MKILAVYPGRFQPFHKGHGEVYKWLKQKFGQATIATSSKVELPKSPFNFNEKKQMMELAGVASSDIKEVKNPYIATEILDHYDPKTTVLVFAISEKDMQEDPRFSFKPTKSGAPSYLQPFTKNAKNLEPFGDPKKPRGYVIVTPTFQFNILGEPMKSATELRKQFADADSATQKKIILDLYGKYSTKVHKLMAEKIKKQNTMNEMREKMFYESITHEKLGPMMDNFVSFASDKLGIKSLPAMKYDSSMETSFGGYNPSTKEIVVCTKDRHPMDIFRTVAHELVHHKQNENGLLGKDIEKEGATGSDIENEANSEAGKIMRWFAKKQPETFKTGTVVESVIHEGINDPGIFKAVFLAGGPGSGKDFILSQTIAGNGLTEINSDQAFEFLLKKNGLDLKMPDEERAERDIVRGRAKNVTKEQQRLALLGRKGVIINGTADDPEKIMQVKAELENMGYDTMMVFVNTSDEVSKERNIQRGQSGGRTVPENIRKEKWDSVQAARPILEKIFGKDRFVAVDNSTDIRTAPVIVKNKIVNNLNKVFKAVRSFSVSPTTNPNASNWIDNEIQRQGIKDFKPAKATTSFGTQKLSSYSPPTSQSVMDKARALGLEYYGFGRFGKNHEVLYLEKGGQLVQKPSNIREENEVNEDLRKWFKEKWVRFDTKGNIKGDCAREPGEGKPKCRPLASAVAMGKDERAKSARRKRREDPVADRKGKGGKPVFVRTDEAATWAQQAAIAIAKKKSGKYDKEGKRIDEALLNEKNKPTNPELWSRAKALAKKKFDVYPSAYANGWASKWYKSKGGGWESVNEAFSDFMNNTSADREWGSTSLTNIYKNSTPGQGEGAEAPDARKKLVRKKLTKEDSYNRLNVPTNNGIGPEFSLKASPALVFGATGISESIVNWANKPETQQKFVEKYGDLAEQKLVEAMNRLQESGCGCESTSPKSVKKIREGLGLGYNDMGTVAKQGKEELPEGKSLSTYKKQIHPMSDFEKKSFKEESAAWQRKEGKDPKGGLNRKGIASYRRENPGSKLSMAVTTPPSKLDPNGKAAKRRKSFCARMGGAPGPMKDEKGRPTRKALALRKWNCEE